MKYLFIGVVAVWLGLGCTSADEPQGAGANGAAGGGGPGAGGAGGAAGSGDAGDMGQAGHGEGGTAGAGGGAGGGALAPVNVVVLGASTACGKNLDMPAYGGMAGGLADSWPNRYVEYLDTTRPGSVVTNLCQAGYNTYDAMPTGTTNPAGEHPVDPLRNITAALGFTPDVVIVSFPAADENSDVNEILSNMQTIESTAEASGVPVWVSTPQPNQNSTPEALANKLTLRTLVLQTFPDHALDFWAPLVGPNDSWDQTKMLTDGVHPNAVGHGLLYDVVVAADIPAAALGEN